MLDAGEYARAQGTPLVVEFWCPECVEEVREGVLVRFEGATKFRPMHVECYEEFKSTTGAEVVLKVGFSAGADDL